MNQITKLLVILLGLALFGLTSCKQEAVTSVEIEFEEPMAGEIVTDASDVHIHIHFTATNGDLHDVEVMLHPDGDVNDLILDFHQHDHAEEFVFEEEVDLSSYPAGTTFHLEAEVCLDHDCEEVEFGDIEFSIP